MRTIESDINGNERVQFAGRLISISDKVLENSNRKNYRVCTINFETAKGVRTNASAFCYEGNYNHPDCVANGGLQPGQEYLCTATQTEYQGKPSVIINMSHLAGVDRASVDMFDFGHSEVEAPVEEHEFTGKN